MASKRSGASWFQLAEHPLATLVALLTCIALVGAFCGWVIATFVFKSDYIRDKSWHDVGHANLRAERLGDEVDRLNTRKLIQGGKLTIQDSADLTLFEKKLEKAAKELDDAKAKAKAKSE